MIRVQLEQIGMLTDICTKCMNDPGHAAEYRLEAFESCPGLTQLWTEPFQAKYDAVDGAVLIRFRSDANGVLQVAANIMEK